MTLGKLAVAMILLFATTLCSAQVPAKKASAKKESQRVRLLNQARQYIEHKRPGLALRLLTPLLERFPGDPTLRVLVGETYYALSDLPMAVEHFEAALKISPELRGRLYRLGLAYQKLDRLDSAQSVFEAMVREKKAKTRAMGYFGLGLNRSMEGHDDDAKKLFERALELDPGAHRARYRLAQLALDRGEQSQAESGFRSVLDRDPMHYGAAYNLSLILARSDRKPEAQRMMDRAQQILRGQERISELLLKLRKAPNQPNIERQVALAYRDLGDWKRATIWFQNVLRRDTSNTDAALELAEAHVKTGHLEQAKKIYQDLAERGVAAARLRLEELEEGS